MKDFTPRAYQQLAADFILDTPRCALWADVGMGKTVTALTVYDMLVLSGYETKPMLVVSTLRIARSVWLEEVPKWTHLRNITVSCVVGTVEDRQRALRKSASVYTINIENVPWLLEYLGGKWPFGMMVSDESTKLRGLRMSVRERNGKRWLQGQGTVRSRKLAKVAYENRAQRWLNLTGTPSPKGLPDLWGQTWFLDFGARLGNSFDAFEQRWFRKGYDGFTMEPMDHAEREIHTKLKDVCLSIQAKDYFDIKDPIEVAIHVELPPGARRIYREMEKNFFAQIEKRTAEAVNAGVKSIKLLQIASGAIYLDPEVEGDDDPRSKDWKELHDRKIEALEDIVEECNGMPLIVAYHFKSDVARLRAAFPRMRFLETKKDEDDFKKGKIQLLGAHPASCGHGLDGFQKVTNRIAFFSHWWNGEERDQIIGRIGPTRQIQSGFERPVYIYDIIAVDTIDEDVIKSHREKLTVQQALKDAVRRRGKSP